MRQSFHPALPAAAVLAAGLAAAVRGGPEPRIPVTPAGEAVFTSTRSVTAIAAAPGGEVWVGTRGGILRRGPDGAWRKFTRHDGLPSHEVRGLSLEPDGLVARFPGASAAWREGRWQVSAAPAGEKAAEAPPGAAVWRGASVEAAPDGLRVKQGARWRQVGLPPGSLGTHISALLPRGETLWAALFGEGIWAWDGKQWQPVTLDLPAAAREITALAAVPGGLWLGTRREGVWHAPDSGAWAQYLSPDEPYDHNCQALAMHRGRLYVSSLEDGLAVRTEQGWRHAAGVLSSGAPRQMVSFGGSLFLRHGNGRVDQLRGESWERDVCEKLPRRQVFALAADADRLYAAQWGGWSEWDGRQWTHFLTLPELQGLPITALCPEGDRLWIGTQGRGMAEVTRATGAVRWHDERSGLLDDWITGAARSAGTLYAGTFVAGAARRDGPRWMPLPELKGQCVTALAPDGEGCWTATREGVWWLGPGRTPAKLEACAPLVDREAQALCPVPGGLWVGTRTGLYFVPRTRDFP